MRSTLGKENTGLDEVLHVELINIPVGERRYMTDAKL